MRTNKLKELKKYLDELRVLSLDYSEEASSFLKVEKYYCTINNGEVIKREKIIKGETDGSAVIVVPVTENGEIITVIEPRVFTKNTVSVGFPAGYVNPNEETSVSAARELKEETGYTFSDLVKLDSFYQDEGISSAYNHVYLATCCKKVSEQSLDADEIVRYMTFLPEELLELEQMGYINSSNTKIALIRTINYLKNK